MLAAAYCLGVAVAKTKVAFVWYDGGSQFQLHTSLSLFCPAFDSAAFDGLSPENVEGNSSHAVSIAEAFCRGEAKTKRAKRSAWTMWKFGVEEKNQNFIRIRSYAAGQTLLT